VLSGTAMDGEGMASRLGVLGVVSGVDTGGAEAGEGLGVWVGAGALVLAEDGWETELGTGLAEGVDGKGEGD
jgi:hypothetical protein